jgi:hypothetical protein
MFDPERTYPHLAALGVKWARVQTGWSRCEPEKGRFDFGWLDAVVDRLRDIGIQPWFNLGYGNRWYIPEAPEESAVGWAPIFSEEARLAWVRFVRHLAEHFAGRIRHWEIWNEPNIANFWKPKKPNAHDYVELVKLTAPVIRDVVPEAIIVGGAFAGLPTKYLQECLEAGLADYVDRVSYHPYRPLPEKNYTQELTEFRKLLSAYRSDVLLWQGECGCPSQTSEFATGAMAKLPWTEKRQAKWLLRRILSDLSEDVELTSYFHTLDLLNYNWGQGRSNLHNYKGLLRGTDYSPKPAYFAYQCLCALFDSDTQRLPSLEIAAEWSSEHRGWANSDGDQNPRGSGPTEVDLRAVGFQRHGWLLVAYWAVADLFQPWTDQTVDLCLPAGGEPSLFRPVLVDPLSQDVYRLPPPLRADGRIRLQNLPLADYPRMVTDEAAVTLLR